MNVRERSVVRRLATQVVVIDNQRHESTTFSNKQRVNLCYSCVVAVACMRKICWCTLHTTCIRFLS